MWKPILSQILFSYSLLHDNVRMRFPVELPVVWGEFLELHWAGYQCLSANPKAGFLPRVRYLLISTPSAHVPSYAHAIASARVTPSAKTTEAKDGKTKGKLELSSSRKCDSQATVFSLSMLCLQNRHFRMYMNTGWGWVQVKAGNPVFLKMFSCKAVWLSSCQLVTTAPVT